MARKRRIDDTMGLTSCRPIADVARRNMSVALRTTEPTRRGTVPRVRIRCLRNRRKRRQPSAHNQRMGRVLFHRVLSLPPNKRKHGLDVLDKLPGRPGRDLPSSQGGRARLSHPTLQVEVANPRTCPECLTMHWTSCSCHHRRSPRRAGLYGVHQSCLGLPGAVHADAQIEVVGTVAGLAAVPSGSRRASSELEREAACHQMRS